MPGAYTDSALSEPLLFNTSPPLCVPHRLRSFNVLLSNPEMTPVYYSNAMDSNCIYATLRHLDGIRLLELERSGPDNLIHGRLIESRLDDTPIYSALSYVWGDPSPNDPILLVNDAPLRIRESLFQAFESLLSNVTTTVIWVDQICINQENDVEREQQVTLMSRIFIQAQRVTCWLGLREDNSDHAFDLLRLLAPHKQDPRVNAEWKRAASRLCTAGMLHNLSSMFDPSSIFDPRRVPPILRGSCIDQQSLVQQALDSTRSCLGF
jgi:hypothetical protein